MNDSPFHLRRYRHRVINGIRRRSVGGHAAIHRQRVGGRAAVIAPGFRRDGGGSHADHRYLASRGLHRSHLLVAAFIGHLAILRFRQCVGRHGIPLREGQCGLGERKIGIGRGNLNRYLRIRHFIVIMCIRWRVFRMERSCAYIAHRSCGCVSPCPALRQLHIIQCLSVGCGEIGRGGWGGLLDGIILRLSALIVALSCNRHRICPDNRATI